MGDSETADEVATSDIAGPATRAGGTFVPAPRAPLDDTLPDRSGTAALAGIVVFAAGWFGVSWLMMGSPPADAIGEAVGGVVAVLVLVSVVGAVRGSRRG